jgi:hypothetical protein
VLPPAAFTTFSLIAFQFLGAVINPLHKAIYHVSVRTVLGPEPPQNIRSALLRLTIVSVMLTIRPISVRVLLPPPHVKRSFPSLNVPGIILDTTGQEGKKLREFMNSSMKKSSRNTGE